MATATTTSGRARCTICEKEKSSVRCEGCSQIFCRLHLNDRHQQLNQQLDEIEINRDLFRQTLDEQINNPHKHFLIQQIDKWECNSIETIQRTAKTCKDQILQFTNQHFQQVENNLKELTNQLKEVRHENDFNEINLKNFKEKIINLEQQLQVIPNVSIQQHSTSFINQIYVLVSSNQTISSFHFNNNIKWKQNGLTIAGGNDFGYQLNQLSYPHGIFVDDDHQCIYIADSENHRIIEWQYDAKMGQIVTRGSGKGNRMNQLLSPTDVIVDKTTDSLIICDWGNSRVVRWHRQNGRNGERIISNIDCWGLTMDNNEDLYVSDTKRHEVRRWKRGEKANGAIVAGGNGKGERLNQLNFPTYLFVDKDYSVYVSDSSNNRVMKWIKGAKEGIVVAGGQGKGNSLTQLNDPQGVTVDDLGNVYVADSLNNRIMCWSKGSKEGRIIVGGNGEGQESNQLFSLGGLSFDRPGNIYAVDAGNHRLQKFDIDLN